MQTLGIWLLLWGLLSLENVNAVKDANYYPPGYYNPNINDEMYWRSSVNILQDLKYFKALYVTFHNCAWSAYSYNAIYAGQENNYNENQNCGGNGDEQSNWYMGKTQCYRANSAFTLYGILKNGSGSHGGNSGGSPCNEGTFINSFMTIGGLEAFLSAMELAGLEIGGDNQGRKLEDQNNAYDYSSYCYAVQPQNDDQQQQQQQQNQDDDHYSYVVDYSEYTSYTVGCVDGQYVRQKFSGAFCHGHNAMGVTDTLDTLNSGIAQAQCIQIFDGDNYDGNQQWNNDNNNQEQNQEHQVELESAVDLLRYSRSCSVRDYPVKCPDPYGKVAGYTRNLDRATNIGANGNFLHPSNKWQAAQVAVGLLLLTAGFVMAIASCFVNKRASRVPRSTDGLVKGDGSTRPKSNIVAKTVAGASAVAVAVATVPGKILDKVQGFAEAEEDNGDIGEEMEMTKVRSEGMSDSEGRGRGANKDETAAASETKKKRRRSLSAVFSRRNRKADNARAVAAAEVDPASDEELSGFAVVTVEDGKRSPTVLSDDEHVSGDAATATKEASGDADLGVKSDPSLIDSAYSAASGLFSGAFDPFSADDADDYAKAQDSAPEIEPAILRKSLSSPEPAKYEAYKEELQQGKKYKRPRLAKLSKKILRNRSRANI